MSELVPEFVSELLPEFVSDEPASDGVVVLELGAKLLESELVGQNDLNAKIPNATTAVIVKNANTKLNSGEGFGGTESES